MTEMLDFCGQRFRISQRALTICFSGPGGPYRGFNTDNVVTLDGTRCSGAAHDGCQKACAIFWREEWLRKVSQDTTPSQPAETDRYVGQIRSTGSSTYYCQATELPKATHKLSVSTRVTRYLSGLRHGNYNAVRMMRSMATYSFWYLRRKLFGVYARGPDAKSTPAEGLDLQPGEWVEVKPMSKIIETLDQRAQNRGLYIFHRTCAYGVAANFASRPVFDKMIVDGTGEMRRLRRYRLSRRIDLWLRLSRARYGRLFAL